MFMKFYRLRADGTTHPLSVSLARVLRPVAMLFLLGGLVALLAYGPGRSPRLVSAALQTQQQANHLLRTLGLPISQEKDQRFQPNSLGNYPNTTAPLSADTTVTPDVSPTNTTRITVAT